MRSIKKFIKKTLPRTFLTKYMKYCTYKDEAPHLSCDELIEKTGNDIQRFIIGRKVRGEVGMLNSVVLYMQKHHSEGAGYSALK